MSARDVRKMRKGEVEGGGRGCWSGYDIRSGKDKGR